MPQAVSSNSTHTPEIHPSYLLEALEEHSYALQAYRLMVVNLLGSNGELASNIVSGLGLILDYIVNELEQSHKQVGILIRRSESSTAG